MLSRTRSTYRTSPSLRHQLTRSIPNLSHFHSLPSRPAQSILSTTPVYTTRDDTALRQIFDTRDYKSPSTGSNQPTGLFNQPCLTTPESFPALARRTTLKARVLVERICTPTALPESTEGAERAFLAMVKSLDRLSDLLCGVIDLAELVRNVHPDEAWNEGANEAYEELCSYMNVLNTHTGLYEALRSLHALLPASTPTKSPQLFAAYAVAIPFLRDFEKSGIHLPSNQRSKFVDLSTSIIQLGRKFHQNISEVKSGVEVSAKEIEDSMGTAFTRRVFSKSPGREIDPMSWEGRVISRQHPVSELRQRLFVAGNTSPQSHVETLEELLRTRSELAQLVGRESWGDVALEDKMAKNPRDVMAFLDSLNEHNRPLASEDLALLRATKKQHTGSYTTPKIYAWDRDYYSDMSNQSRGGPPIPDISPFFSLGTCFQGLSRLFTSLYGIRFEVAPLSPGETWDPSVRKLRVIDEDEGTIGTIYCDLFARDGKANGAAHYTVRCSRRLDDDHIAGMDYGEDGMATVEGVKIAREELEGLEVIPVKWRGREGTFQEPIIVLVCAFGEEDASSPAGLQWGEVETLFHEMGHAIHSMIGRTDYHNVSGTRCATDFVELPSILMEHFIASPAVLALFARHHSTDRQLPQFLLNSVIADRRRFSALETSTQITMASLDQVYHSSIAGSSSFDSTALLKSTQEKYNVIPYVEGTNWQTQFGHLFGYGSTYYSYLFDRSIAARIFKLKFAQDPLSRDRGEEFKKGVLRYGGGKDCWEMVGGLVGDEQVMRGGTEGMKVIGEWGIEADN